MTVFAAIADLSSRLSVGRVCRQTVPSHFAGRLPASVLCIPLCVLLVACRSAPPQDPVEPYGDPVRFEADIARFERLDAQSPPPSGAVLCVGSSSIRMWHKRIGDDLAPLTVIPRGFGGSNMNDLLHYVDRVVLAYRPRAVVIYEGDNDIAQGVSPRMIAQTFDELVARVHDALPGCRVYVLAIKPSPRRWALWPEMVEANRLLERACARDQRMTFIDIATPMLGPDGKPRPGLFVSDQLHLNQAGYDLWRQTIRPVLIRGELEHEPSARGGGG